MRPDRKWSWICDAAHAGGASGRAGAGRLRQPGRRRPCDRHAARTAPTGLRRRGASASLSDWGQLAVGGGALVLGEGVTPYALNTALFTDYAHKLRTVWIPPDGGTGRL
jgi:hypothetical protein